ncbi:MAG: hypothetical protein HC848_02175 [Limnobacter sp.]|nr:hypothetical protein [Limnobacter sp.]
MPRAWRWEPKTLWQAPWCFLAGEFIKVGASIVILFVAGLVDPDLIWWPLLLAVVATLKSYFWHFF